MEAECMQEDSGQSIISDPFEEATSLLISWNLPHLCEIFREQEVCINALRDITDEDIYELIPKIGPRSIFRARLQEWREQQTTIYDNMGTAHEEEVYHRTRQYVEEHSASTNSNQSPQFLIESSQQLYHQHHNPEDMNTSANIEISVSPTTAHSIDSGIKIETIELSEEEWHDIGIVKIPENNISSIVNDRGTTPANMSYSHCETLMNVPNHTADRTLEPKQDNLNSSIEMCELYDSFDESCSDSCHETKDLKNHRHLNLNVFNILQSDDNTKDIVSSKRKSLSRIERKLISDAIVSYVIDKQIRLQTCCFPFIIEKILKLYPKEKFKTYLNQTIPSRTTGLLITKYRRESILLRKIGIKRYQERNRKWLQSNNKK